MQNRDRRGRFVGGHSLNFGKKLPEEVKNKISETLKKAYLEGRVISWNKGRRTPENTRRKISESEKGKKLSEDTKKKISKAKKGIKFSETWRKNLSGARRGIEFSKEHREKLSKSHKGKVLLEEHKEKISKTQLRRWDAIGRKGDKRAYQHLVNRKYKKWREAAFKRDNYTCQKCGKTNCYLEVHHIQPWAKSFTLRYKVENGITFCKECHKLITNYGHKIHHK